MSFKDIKLVVIDIDGTLLDNDRRLHPETMRVLEQVQKQGIIVTLASGRTFISTARIAGQLKIEAPIIAHNGAYIARVKDDEPLFEAPIVMNRARDMVALLEASGYYIKVYVRDELYVQVVTAETLEFSTYHNIAYHAMGSGNLSKLDKDPLKIVIIDAPRGINHVFKLLEPWNTQFNICRDTDSGIEIVNGNVNKGTALEKVCAMLKVEKSQVMAFGNEGNDLEMINSAGVGVAMGNAYAGLKEHATIVTRTNDDLGVAYALDKYLLKDYT